MTGKTNATFTGIPIKYVRLVSGGFGEIRASFTDGTSATITDSKTFPLNYLSIATHTGYMPTVTCQVEGDTVVLGISGNS